MVSGKASLQESRSQSTESGACGLDDLEEQRLLIQQQLAEAESSDAEMVVTDSVGDESIPPLPNTPAPGPPPLPTDTPPVTPQTDRIIPIHSTPLDQPIFSRTSSSASISVEGGTPLAKNVLGKKDSLPDASVFSANIEQDIPFENLPNATGTYERMRVLIGSIRKHKTDS